MAAVVRRGGGVAEVQDFAGWTRIGRVDPCLCRTGPRGVGRRDRAWGVHRARGGAAESGARPGDAGPHGVVADIARGAVVPLVGALLVVDAGRGRLRLRRGGAGEQERGGEAGGGECSEMRANHASPLFFHEAAASVSYESETSMTFGDGMVFLLCFIPFFRLQWPFSAEAGALRRRSPGRANRVIAGMRGRQARSAWARR